MKHVDYIITSKHLGGSNRAWVMKLKTDIEKKRGIKITMKDTLAKSPVFARIYRGHWIADCDVCNGAMFVDPSEPVFFCLECFNRKENGKLRPVIFPEDRQNIEAAVLERPINDYAGVTDSERAMRAFIQAGDKIATRDWIPGETAEDIRKQNAVIQGMKKKRGK